MASRVGTVIVGSILALAMGCGSGASAAVVAAADVVPEATFQWGTNGPDKWGQVGISSGGTANVTSDFPNNTNGSMRLELPNTSSKAGLAYYPTKTFGKLRDLKKATYQWMVQSTDVPNQAPVLRLYLRDALGVHKATLVYTPDIAGVSSVAPTAWITGDMMSGQDIWQGKSGAIEYQVRHPFSYYVNDPRYQDLVVFAVEGGAGNGSSGFVGAIDNIEVEGVVAGESVTVSANFEMVPPSASISCDRTTLADSDGETSTCTVTLTRPATASTVINLTVAGDATRYGGCAGPLTILAGDSTVTCVVTATANTVKGDGDVTVSIGIAPPNDVMDYAVPSDALPVQILIANDDGAPVPPTVAATPVPTLGDWTLIALSVLLSGGATIAMRKRRLRH
ncbi:IPTL-CTERM sorting domain-containing protein [Diaphorobacter sp. HDW4B]|uniref:IPTL-CTERM sorting domain-containing protein n=1 Tax=Diaphorobacter sp. HDW4B TaxID=2714925 RepID=UPI0014098595|nr:IPTL-CTERM sorting domain-containing protein [Diaphorobacter sp. HDW4B]QIL72056.1 IPTL-CTERM sorting domain-containing protein [Diaphorobacter sp. HDW4B]